MKIKKIIALLCILMMLTSSLAFAALPNRNDLTEQQGNENGQVFGELDGQIDGRSDAENKLTNDYSRHLLSDINIQYKFNLKRDDYYYGYYFLQSYKAYYRTAYEAAYREVITSEVLIHYQDADSHGSDLGQINGKALGTVDFNNRRENDWQNAYNNFLANGTLVSRFSLDNETDDYRLAFEAAFKKAFMEAYTKMYQELNLTYETRNVNYWKVSMDELHVAYNDLVPNIVNGNTSASTTDRVMIDIEAGTVYEDNYIGITKVLDDVNNVGSKLENLTKAYKILANRNTESIKLEKPIKLSFTYSGDGYAGIYKLINGSWVYQISKFEKDRIYTEIPSGYYAGGTYAVFKDDSVHRFTDVMFNWANDEINALVRRDTLELTTYFRPRDYITREELAQMIYKAYAQNNPLQYTPVPRATDIAQSPYQAAINYVVDQQEMALDASGAFNPQGKVTYNDIEWIMSHVKDYDFKWQPYEDKMLYDAYTRSGSLVSMSQPITRAEIAYMLYYEYQ